MTDRKKLLVLLGAGSSFPFGMPSVAELGCLACSWSEQWAYQHKLANHYRVLEDAIATYFLSGDARPRPTVSFEKVLGEMAALSHWMTPPPLGNSFRQTASEGAAPPLLEFRSNGAHAAYVEASDQLSSILTALAAHMRQLCLGIDRSNSNLQSYKDLARGLSERFDVGVYNLNYDNLALIAWPNSYAGFKAGQFDPLGIHLREEWGFVYHLHGSIHHSLNSPTGDRIVWRDLDLKFEDGFSGRSDDLRSEGRYLPVSTLVAGGFKLDQILVEPFHSLHAALVRHVYEADAILIAGYGFGDEHVNRALANRLASQACPRPPVMVLTRSEERTDPMGIRYPFGVGRLVQCGLRAESAQLSSPYEHS
jgi:hypothetical protein